MSKQAQEIYKYEKTYNKQLAQDDLDAWEDENEDVDNNQVYGNDDADEWGDDEEEKQENAYEEAQ